jgi:hypothetical protein
LTEAQRKEIGAAWAKPENRQAWQAVRKTLGCSADEVLLDEAEKE